MDPSFDSFRQDMLSRHGRMAVSPNALAVLERRYLKSGGRTETPEDMVARVAWNVAQAEKAYGDQDVRPHAERFYALIHSLVFVPNSPTLMNAGRDLQQLSACFVLPVGDSMEEIFEAVKNTALIHKSGGGTGFSFSRLRPKGDKVGSTSGVSSGPISFMKVFDAATEHVKQGGTRRGANMGILRVDHPDILQFIDCKRDKTQLTNFNLSVAVTDTFMKAVEDGTDYPLVSPKDGSTIGALSAREVYAKIVESAWRDGEPGIVFIDRMNDANPTPEIGAFEATNPCGEQPLLPFESCNLGSVNLGRLVIRDQDGSARIDEGALDAAVRIAVRFLDNVIDMNRYPLAAIGDMTRANRKIGLGVMGFADMLALLGVAYDSERALEIADAVMGRVASVARDASHCLARERGNFPNFDRSAYRNGPERRNATVTTIAPTGTISIIAGASSGIEPLFAVAYWRNVMDDDRLMEVHPGFRADLAARGLASDGLIARIAEAGGPRHADGVPDDLKAVYGTAHDVSPEWHLRMQAAFQAHVDNAVSKTVNFPADATIEDVRKVYDLAFSLRCKGVTVYRDKSREGQVLNVGATPKAADPAPAKEPFRFIAPRPRPKKTVGETIEKRTSCGKMYVTLNRDEHGLFEVFLNMGKAGGCAASQSEAIGRVVSAALRAGVNPGVLVKQLKGISCHRPCGLGPKKILSCADALSRAIEEAVQEMDEAFLAQFPAGGNGVSDEDEAPAPAEIRETETSQGACPDCGGQVEMQEGCLKCRSCGFSECG